MTIKAVVTSKKNFNVQQINCTKIQISSTAWTLTLPDTSTVTYAVSLFNVRILGAVE